MKLLFLSSLSKIITSHSLGIMDYLNTEISTSKQKKFSLVTFVDTPGLVDGDMKYPFDVNQSISWLGKSNDPLFICYYSNNILVILSTTILSGGSRHS